MNLSVIHKRKYVVLGSDSQYACFAYCKQAITTSFCVAVTTEHIDFVVEHQTALVLVTELFLCCVFSPIWWHFLQTLIKTAIHDECTTATTHYLVTTVAVFNIYGSVFCKNILVYIQQDATLHSLFYLETALHVLGGTTTHHQERKQLSTASGICHTITATCRYSSR
jgi:hypothetical protein